MSLFPDEVRRSWADKEYTRIHCYQFVNGRHTIPEIIEDLISRGVDWREVSLNYSATWTDEPTLEEKQRHSNHEARTAQRLEAWERKTLVRLTEKYGSMS